MSYCIEAWTFPSDEEPCEEEMIDHAEIQSEEAAMQLAWEWMKAGFQARLWIR